MNLLTIPLMSIVIFGADAKLAPQTRLECGGDATQVALSPDGRSLFAVVKNDDRQDLVVWDVPGGAKTILARETDGVLIMSSNGERSLLSPDGKSLLSFIMRKRAKDECEVEAVVWDVQSRSRNALFTMQGKQLWLITGSFSADGRALAVPDGIAKKLRVWRRDAATKWSVARVLDVAQGAEGSKQVMLTTALTPDGKQAFVSFLAGGESVAVHVEKWDVVSGRKVHFSLKPITLELDVFALAMRMALSADGKTLCVGSEEGRIGVDASLGATRYIIRSPSGFGVISLSPTGRTGAFVPVPVIAPLVEPPICISFWNVDDGTQRRQVSVAGPIEPLAPPTFTADSRYFVLATGKGRVYLIDAKKAEIRSSFTVGASVKGLFTLNTGEIAVVGTEPKSVVIWKIKTP